jgi:dTDP-4-dehydrorhamnose 3,5-epimerase
MRFESTSIPDIILVQPTVFSDRRGFFMETFQRRLFEEAGLPSDFVQDNHSGSERSTLRGLHYQICQPQGKLVRVVMGEIFDVAVDLRQHSESFGKWVGTYLSAQDKNQIWIPVGFAHGFYVLSDWAEVVYKVTDFYAPECERTLLWNDPEIGITWPLMNGQEPLISEKDSQGKRLKEAEVYS